MIKKKEAGVTIKGQYVEDGIVLYLDCEGGFTNLHM